MIIGCVSEQIEDEVCQLAAVTTMPMSFEGIKPIHTLIL